MQNVETEVVFNASATDGQVAQARVPPNKQSAFDKSNRNHIHDTLHFLNRLGNHFRIDIVNTM